MPRKHCVLARRYQITAEINDQTCLCAQANPALLAAPGVGADTASALLTAGDNPERQTSFAALCGASPVQASSGQTIRHRPTGGDRQANNALWPSPPPGCAATSPPSYTAKRKAKPAARSSAETPHRPRDIPPTHQPATNTQQRWHPTPTNPDHPRRPTTPHPRSSHNSNEASTTTNTSENGSPTNRFVKNRSILGSRSYTKDGSGLEKLCMAKLRDSDPECHHSFG